MPGTPHRNRLRFSLRTLLVVVTLAGCGLALYARARAVKLRETWALERMPPQYGRPAPTGHACPWPLSVLLGADFFQHVRSLQVWSYDTESCQLIAHFPYLDRLHVKVDDLFGPPLSNADLASCQSLKHLTDLYIEGRCFDDAALLHFANSRPRRIVLRFMRVDGSGLRHLDGKNLETLSLYQMPLTDEGLGHLKQFPNLRHLEIHGGDISPRGLTTLAHLRHLELLVLTNVNVDDTSLGHLPRSIRQLGLHDVGVTNDAIEQLADLDLEQLELTNTRITAAGIDRLRKLSPNCKYRWSPADDAASGDARIEIEPLFRAHP